MEKRGTFLTLLRFLLGALFLWAGIAKGLDPAGFLEVISGYRLLPHPAAAALAFYLPFLEILCAAALLTGKWTEGASRLLLALMALFIGALLSAWARGLDVRCGCFGLSGGKTDYPLWLARDLLLMGLLAAIRAE